MKSLYFTLLSLEMRWVDTMHMRTGCQVSFQKRLLDPDPASFTKMTVQPITIHSVSQLKFQLANLKWLASCNNFQWVVMGLFNRFHRFETPYFWCIGEGWTRKD